MVNQRQVAVYQPAVPIRVVAVFRDTEPVAYEVRVLGIQAVVNDKHKTVDHDLIVWNDGDVAPVPLSEVRSFWAAEFIIGPADEEGWDNRIKHVIEKVQRAEGLKAAKKAAGF